MKQTDRAKGETTMSTTQTTDTTPFTRLKVITSHVGHDRFLAECDAHLGEIPYVKSIRSPYAYSFRWPVYAWRGTPVIIRETSHKRYEVFAVPQDMVEPIQDTPCACWWCDTSTK
jgi:hypothetical protein